MLLLCLQKHDHVVEESAHISSMWSENPVHHLVECCWSIYQPERHDKELVQSEAGTKSCLVDILRLDTNLMVSTLQVYWTEES